MTEWVLVVMMCSRECYPQYATIYPSQKACMANVEKTSDWSLPKKYCVPLVLVDGAKHD